MENMNPDVRVWRVKEEEEEGYLFILSYLSTYPVSRVQNNSQLPAAARTFNTLISDFSHKS